MLSQHSPASMYISELQEGYGHWTNISYQPIVLPGDTV